MFLVAALWMDNGFSSGFYLGGNVVILRRVLLAVCDTHSVKLVDFSKLVSSRFLFLLDARVRKWNQLIKWYEKYNSRWHVSIYLLFEIFKEKNCPLKSNWSRRCWSHTHSRTKHDARNKKKMFGVRDGSQVVNYSRERRSTALTTAKKKVNFVRYLDSIYLIYLKQLNVIESDLRVWWLFSYLTLYLPFVSVPERPRSAGIVSFTRNRRWINKGVYSYISMPKMILSKRV